MVTGLLRARMHLPRDNILRNNTLDMVLPRHRVDMRRHHLNRLKDNTELPLLKDTPHNACSNTHRIPKAHILLRRHHHNPVMARLQANKPPSNHITERQQDSPHHLHRVMYPGKWQWGMLAVMQTLFEKR